MCVANSGLIALEDGTVFRGRVFGAAGTVVGEAVFNTSMTGYQEIITDPSYCGQIVTMTAPQIGNYGINDEDVESEAPKVAGLVVRELSPIASNWRSSQNLDAYLEAHGIPALQRVDTRMLTKKLRREGSLKACLSTEEGLSAAEAVRRARAWPGLIGVDFVKKVTSVKPSQWRPKGPGDAPFTVSGTQLTQPPPHRRRYPVAAFDFGAKQSIFRKLHYHGFDVHVLPASTPPEFVKELDPSALFLSNGPGDPSALPYVYKTIAQLIQHYPTFGICLGHQILTHALGATTFKLKFGHRGGNQPVRNIETGYVAITSQNHGFAAERRSLEKRGAMITEINLNDNTVEGLRHKDLPVYSVQYHPEAAPGPHDADVHFETFYKIVARNA